MPSPSTPLSSPSSSRAAARQQERSHRTLDSPENRRIPAGPSAPPTSITSLPPNQTMGPVIFNGQEYHNLPPDLTTRLLSLAQPSIPSQHHQQPSTSASTLAPAFNPTFPMARQTHTPAQLAELAAALPPLNSQFRPMQLPVSDYVSSLKLIH
jgi:hypothetical protein